MDPIEYYDNMVGNYNKCYASSCLVQNAEI